MRGVVRQATVRSLAKINLDLRILNKRSDNFHELRTVFQSISLADTIEISCEPATRKKVSIDDELQIPDNLIVRAANAVLDVAGAKVDVRFRLSKQIPMGGGLGGGSSNAAAVLLALPVLAGVAIPMERLQWIAHDLGSDVPFFLHGGTRLGVGRGGELYPQPDIHSLPVLLIFPPVQVATGPAYAALDRGLTFTGSSSSINSFQAYAQALECGRSAMAASPFSANDFESVVFKQHPQLAKVAARLRKFSPAVRMSGSGSTIFALFESKDDRGRAVSGLVGDRAFEGCRVIEAELVSRGGYRRLWRRQLAEHLVPGRQFMAAPKPVRAMRFNHFKVFTGNANPALAAEICYELGCSLAAVNVKQFSDGEVHLQIQENVRGADVFVVQPTCTPVDKHLMELLLMMDALKRASAERITAVLPYYGYARQDRKDRPRMPISARLVASLLERAGANRILALDLHAAQIQGFFDVPVDHLFATPVMIDYFDDLRGEGVTVVSPDAGGVERARAFAKRMEAPLAIIDKRRTDVNVAEVMHIIGEVEGQHCLIVDDLIDTAGTLVKAGEALLRQGAKSVRACATHAVLSGPAVERIENSEIEEVIVTNSIPLGDHADSCRRIKVLSVAPLLAKAIQSIHEDGSVSTLFV